MEIPPKSAESLARAKAGLEKLGRQYGLYMTFNDQSKHSRLALKGAKFAEEQGLGNEYHDAVFAAQFQQQKNINDPEVLAELAQQIGLDPDQFSQALAARKYEQAVVQDLEEAYRLGIPSVPCFIVEDRKAFGVQSYEALERLLLGTEPSEPDGLRIK